MTISSIVGGQRVVVPGVYSVLSVENNLASVTPGARNILIIGEASKGAPGSLLNLSGVFFQDFESLKAFYGTGPLVDAAFNIFSNQASPAFSGQVGSVFCYKTNASTLASVVLGSYGSVNAAEFGEDGNLISAQVQNAALEIKPSLTFQFLPGSGISNLSVALSGRDKESYALSGEVIPSAVQSALNGHAGLSATGGQYLEIFSAGQQASPDDLTLSIGSNPSDVVITYAEPLAGSGYAAIQAGSIVYIPQNSVIAGGGNANVGAYLVTGKTASSISATKILSNVSGHELPDPVAAVEIDGDQSLVAEAELMAFSPITVNQEVPTADGVAATLEIFSGNGDLGIASRIWTGSLQSPVSAPIAAVASISLTVSGNSGTIAIQDGSLSVVPKAGDVVVIRSGSPIAGTDDCNVGHWIVQSAGSVAISLLKINFSDVAPETVASTALNGNTSPFQIQPAVVSTSVAAKILLSSAERQVRFAISRQSDGQVFPNTAVGGRVVLELSYLGTEATVTITKAGRLQTSVVGGSGVNLDIPLNKYATLGDLAAFINTKTGYAARVPSLQLASLNPRTVLDQVDAVGIASGHDVHAFAGRIKSDFSDVVQLFNNNFGLVAFSPNQALPNFAGLPVATNNPVFLDGGSTGGTSNLSILQALDAALKIEVTQIVPLFSRDANEDVLDGLTEPSSNYSIEAINAALRSHIATASTIEYRKERFGIASIHASFEDSILAASSLSYERIQMAFQMSRAVDAEGNSRWFAPWMTACMIAAGRVQAVLGTSMLRKSFNMTDIKHIGAQSIFSDSLVLDFDPDTKQLDRAIEAGLLTLRAVTGFGVRLESPDLVTRSRQNDPKAWFYERASVQFVLDEVLKTTRTTLDGFIGNRFSDTSPSVIRKSLNDVLDLFISQGALRGYSIDRIQQVGTTYECTLSVRPVEAIEFITLNVLAQRDQQGG